MNGTNKTKSLWSIALILISFFALTVLISCKNNDQKENSSAKKEDVNNNICDLLSQQDIGEIYNITVDSVKNTLQNSDPNGQRFVSQCTYFVKSNRFKTVSILLRYFANGTNPKTFDELVERNAPGGENLNEDQQKIADEAKNSFLNGKKINDIGDSGVWYNWAEIPSLMLYFNDHYHLVINLIGFEYNEETYGMSRKVAERIISHFNI